MNKYEQSLLLLINGISKVIRINVIYDFKLSVHEERFQFTIDFQLNALIQMIIKKTSKFNLCDKKTIFFGCDNDFLLLELVVVGGIKKK